MEPSAGREAKLREHEVVVAQAAIRFMVAARVDRLVTQEVERERDGLDADAPEQVGCGLFGPDETRRVKVEDLAQHFALH